MLLEQALKIAADRCEKTDDYGLASMVYDNHWFFYIKYPDENAMHNRVIGGPELLLASLGAAFQLTPQELITNCRAMKPERENAIAAMDLWEPGIEALNRRMEEAEKSCEERAKEISFDDIK